MTRPLRRQIARIADTLNVQTLTADTALTLVEAGLVDMDRLSDEQLDAIVGPIAWDQFTDAELVQIAAGELTPPLRTDGKRSS